MVAKPTAAVTALIFVLSTYSLGQLPTLRKLLTDDHVENIQALPATLLDATINGYAFDGDDREYLGAFFDMVGKLHAALLNRATGRWQYTTVSVDDAWGVGNSILDIKRTRQYIYLDSHINPSAGRLLVLSHDLKLRRALSGWRLAMLPDESVVYHQNQIHFAPTHSLEISIFNATNLTEMQIYPPKPYEPVRRRFIERVSQEYNKRGEDWFRNHNHHMNPELFDSRLVGDVTLDGSGTMSFLVQFGDPDNALDPLTFTERVRVTCSPTGQIQRLQCHEARAQAEAQIPG